MSDRKVAPRSKFCRHCGAAFEQKKPDGPKAWERRIYCSLPCAIKAQGGAGRRLLVDRFFSHVEKDPGEDGCWRWKSPGASGYGIFYLSSLKGVPAHRWLYERVYGHVPAELHIDHKCRVRCCVRPDHLEAVTPHENTLRSMEARFGSRKVCRNGHPINAETSYENPSRPGERICRPCGQLSVKRRRARMTPGEYRAYRDAANRRNRAYKARQREKRGSRER